jgi:hypothetical protein
VSIPFEEAVQVSKEIADALAIAHQRGIWRCQATENVTKEATTAKMAAPCSATLKGISSVLILTFDFRPSTFDL